jgi:hypothetical protein
VRRRCDSECARDVDRLLVEHEQPLRHRRYLDRAERADDLARFERRRPIRRHAAGQETGRAEQGEELPPRGVVDDRHRVLLSTG